ncbi:hypothetical protein DIPPA_17578 [Diplonema papillatum]|nr:hypothetical protein DIPPA_17578 [Diplonema papillatum]
MPVEVNPAGCAVVGGQYATAADFTDAVVEEAVATGRCLVRRRKEKGRVRFECSGTTSTGGACAFKCTAMLHADTETYHVSRADAHSCVFTTGSGDEKANELGRLHSEWVTRRIAAHVEAEPDLPVKGIVASMRTNGVTITSKVARLAKAQALQETGLDAASGFRKLRAYFAAVKCVDAEAVTSIDTKPGVATEEDANPRIRVPRFWSLCPCSTLRDVCASDHFSLVRGKPSRQLLRKLPMQLRFNFSLL